MAAGLLFAWALAEANSALERVRQSAAIEGGGAPVWAVLHRPTRVEWAGARALVLPGRVEREGGRAVQAALVGSEGSPCTGACPCESAALDEDEVLLSADLADALGASTGDELDVAASGGVRWGGLFARSGGNTRRLRVSGIAASCGLGGLGGDLARDRRVAFLSLSLLQRAAELPGRVNRLMATHGQASALSAALEEAALRLHGASVRSAARGYLLVEHEDLYLPDSVVDSASIALGGDPSVEAVGFAAAFLATEVSSSAGRSSAYALGVAVSPEDFLFGGRPAPLLHEGGAELFGVVPGDTLELGRPEREGRLRIEVGRVEASGAPAADPDLLPSFPGIHGAERCADFALPIPFDARRVTAADEAYWARHRGAPHLVLPWEGERPIGATSLRVLPVQGRAAEAGRALERALRKAVGELAPAASVTTAVQRAEQAAVLARPLRSVVTRFGAAGALGALLLSFASAVALARGRANALLALRRDGLPGSFLSLVALGRQGALGLASAAASALIALASLGAASALPSAAASLVSALAAWPAAALWPGTAPRKIGAGVRIGLWLLSTASAVSVLLLSGEARTAAFGLAALALAPALALAATPLVARLGPAWQLAVAELCGSGLPGLLAIAALAAASFLVSSLEVARRREPVPSAFALLAEATRPVARDAASGLAAAGVDALALRATPGPGAACAGLESSAPLRAVAASEELLRTLGAGPQPPPSARGEVDAYVEATTSEWLLRAGPGDAVRLPLAGGERTVRIAGLLSDGPFPGTLLIPEAQFDRVLPMERGARLFLVRREEDAAGLTRALAGAKLTFDRVSDVRRRELLAEAAQTKLLSSFVWLGALAGAGGWALGSLGRLLARRRASHLLLAHGVPAHALVVAAVGEGLLFGLPPLVVGTGCGLLGTSSLLPGASALLSLPGAAVAAGGMLAVLVAVRAASAAWVLRGDHLAEIKRP
ncbi:MAG: hypothetical protein HYZ28_18975 [Myxococcales bacterium]|nr:hypothetical protein [Myxococcales bacterium]